MQKKTKFITFEGGEGSGKTTQSKILCEFLKKNSIDYIWTREIGGTDLAEKIRDLVVNEEFDNISEVLLIMAARNEHIKNKIIPALESGKWVVCDRFVDSTAAYQAKSMDDMIKIFDLHKQILNNFLPDITFYIKLEPQIGLNRALERGGNNKFEAKDIDFHERIIKNYNFLSEKFKSRFQIIDGSQKLEEVSKEIENILEKIM